MFEATLIYTRTSDGQRVTRFFFICQAEQTIIFWARGGRSCEMEKWIFSIKANDQKTEPLLLFEVGQCVNLRWEDLIFRKCRPQQSGQTVMRSSKTGNAQHDSFYHAISLKLQTNSGTYICKTSQYINTVVDFCFNYYFLICDLAW